jgi:hypothetical protein
VPLAGARNIHAYPNLRKVGVLVRKLGVITLLLLMLPPAALAHRYHVAIRLPATATSGSPVPFTWSASAPGVIVVQKPEGTAHVWRTILRLHGHGGASTLPPTAIGTYHMRIAAINGRQTFAESQVFLHVYGQVPFATLFHRNGVQTVTTPTNTFDYVAVPGLEDTPPLTVTNNNCTSLHIEWDTHIIGYRPPQIPPELQATLSLVQEAREPQSVTARYETISTLDATIEGKSWSLEAKNSNTEWDLQGYVNGYGICDSTEELD